MAAAFMSILLLYAVFVSTVIRGMQWQHVAQPDGVTIRLVGTPQTFYSMFWYSGRLLIAQFANAHGLHIPPSAWALRVLGPPPVASLRPFVLGWLYPPTMGLLAMLQACLPLGASYFVWRGLYFAISGFLLRRAGLGWRVIVMGLVSPAAWLDLLGGENGTLTGGLLVSALLLFDSAPAAGGAIAGFLCIKPQLGIMLPVILVQRRFWPALAGFSACVGVLVLLSVLLEGWYGWLWFLSGARNNSTAMISASFAHYFPAIGDTVFFMARSFGGGLGQSWALQAGASAVSAWLIWRLWRDPECDRLARVAATVSLAVLLVPYGFLYDLVGFAMAMAAMCLRAPGLSKLVYAVLWLFTGYSGVIAPITGHIFMPVAAALGAVMAWRECHA